MGLPGLERQPQRHAVAQQMLLANDLAQLFGAQTLRKGLVGRRT
jgi:hypothetical protein